MKRGARVSGPAMSEAELEAAILGLAGLLGWKRAHFRPAMLPSGRWATHMAGDAGFPDLVLAREGRIVFAELKSARGRASREQEAWLEILGSVPGVVAVLWRPSDWRSGAIEAVLQGEGPEAVAGRKRSKGWGLTDADLWAIKNEDDVRFGAALVRRRVLG